MSRRFTAFIPRILCAMCATAVVAMTFFPAFAGADAPYAVKTFSNRTMDSAEAPYSVAGGHPDLSVTELSVPLKDLHPAEPVEVPNGTYIRPPVGFLGNPAAAPRCPFAKIPFSEGLGGASPCPPGSQVGIAVVTLEIGGQGCTAPCEPGTSPTRSTTCRPNAATRPSSDSSSCTRRRPSRSSRNRAPNPTA